MPTRRLPIHPNFDQLKHQAKDLVRGHNAGAPQALQRIREFHPRFREAADSLIRQSTFTLSDAHLALAREYGFASWRRLKAAVEAPATSDVDKPLHERIEDADFRRAVDFIDVGDVEGLRGHLVAHPTILDQRVAFEGMNYFRNPSLLEFTAENPIRRGTMAPNILQIVRMLLDLGAARNRESVDSTLALIASGRVPRERGVQTDLIGILCDAGADPNKAMLAALAHGEFDAVDALLRCGATLDLPVAAATGRTAIAHPLLASAGSQDRHRAFALGAQHGRTDIVRLLLDAGEDPNRFNPVGVHAHSTPLHQAALAGHEDVVRLLVEHGARLDIKDILFHGTPADWAAHANQTQVETYLRSAAN